jgi:ankyrin repeat protein
MPAKKAAPTKKTTVKKATAVKKVFRGRLEVAGPISVAARHQAKMFRLITTAGLVLTEEDQREGWTPLHRAAFAGHEVATRALVDAKADMTLKTRQGLTPLHLAASEGPFDEVFDKDGNPSHPAHRCGAMAATVLVDAGADLEAKADMHGGDGRTALHISAQKGQAGVARVLVEAGSDIEAKRGSCGVTPLHDACLEGHASKSNSSAPWRKLTPPRPSPS